MTHETGVQSWTGGWKRRWKTIQTHHQEAPVLTEYLLGILALQWTGVFRSPLQWGHWPPAGNNTQMGSKNTNAVSCVPLFPFLFSYFFRKYSTDILRPYRLRVCHVLFYFCCLVSHVFLFYFLVLTSPRFRYFTSCLCVSRLYDCLPALMKFNCPSSSFPLSVFSLCSHLFVSLS